jgi:hypothetical protein
VSGTVTYRMKHYTRAGAYVEDVVEREDDQLDVNLNGQSQVGFSLYLDNPLVASLQPLQSVIKMWRDVDDPVRGISYSQPNNLPTIGGHISSRQKQGDKMVYTVSDPVWSLMFHFHILNHRLGPDTLEFGPGLVGLPGGTYTLPMTISALMWKLVDLINNAFGLGTSGTGFKRNGPTGEDTAVIDGIYHVPRGSWTWDDHISTLLNIAGGPELQPVYVEIASDPTIAYWFCKNRVGVDRTPAGAGQVKFQYGTAGTGLESDDSLDELDFEETYEPKRWGNWSRVYGHGDIVTTPFSATEFNGSALDPLGVPNVGVYMYQDQQPDIVSATKLDSIASVNLKKFGMRPITMTPTIATTGEAYFGIDFGLGDLVLFEYQKGQFHMPEQKIRIYGINERLSNNGQAAVTTTLAEDYLGRFA